MRDMSSTPEEKKQKKRRHDDSEADDETNDDKRPKDEDNSDEDVSVDSEEDSDMDEADDEEDDSDINKELNIDFSAYQAIDDDFNGIKSLLRQLWLKENIDVSQLAQLLVDQNTICSVLKQDEDEETADDSDAEEEDLDVYGVTSVIPLVSYEDKDCVKQIKDILTGYTPKERQIHKLLTTSSAKIGLIVNERFANLPPKISQPSYHNLIRDLKEAKSGAQLKHLNLDFDWYLMVCKVLIPKNSGGGGNASKSSSDPSVTYVNAEEELFDECADDRFEYSVAKQCDSDVYDWKDDDNLLEPFRRLLLLSSDNWNKAIDRLNDEFK